MAFTAKDWRDYPDTSTPITAVALEDMEGRLSTYTDDVGDTKEAKAGAGTVQRSFWDASNQANARTALDVPSNTDLIRAPKVILTTDRQVTANDLGKVIHSGVVPRVTTIPSAASLGLTQDGYFIELFVSGTPTVTDFWTVQILGGADIVFQNETSSTTFTSFKMTVKWSVARMRLRDVNGVGGAVNDIWAVDGKITPL